MNRPGLCWHAGPPENGFGETSRPTVPNLLTGLGLRIEDLKAYKEAFLTGRDVWRFWSKGWNWRAERRPIEDRDLLRHLAGYRPVGLAWGVYVSALVLDFDVHGDRSQVEVIALGQRVLRQLPGEWLCIQSSHSGGFHAYCYLSDPIQQWQAARWLNSHLEMMGEPHRPGVIESRMDRNNTRLPFGIGSMLLDPITLEPQDRLTLAESIHAVVKHRSHHALDAGAIQTWCRENRIAPTNREFNETVERLRSDGLFPGIGTWEAIWRLSWHLQAREGKSQVEAAAWLKSWIRNRHNGLSTRINSGRMHQVYDQIEDTVRRFDPEKVSHRSAGRRRTSAARNLTETELRWLLRRHLSFPDLRDAAKILGYAKANMRRHSQNPLYSNVSRFSHKKAGLTYVAQNLRELRDWYVPLPWAVMRGLGVRDPGRVVLRLCEMGALEPKRRAHADSGRCAEYWVRISLSGGGQPEIESLAVGLWRILGDKGLRREYGKDRAARIAEEAKGRIVPKKDVA